MQSLLADAELARLEALFDCRVLDTQAEQLFDQTARHAAYLCGTPIALVGFIDAARVWYKSKVGWEYSEIPRRHSFCQYAILQPDVLVISDAAADDRFRNCPIVTHAGIRFYAGAPLLTKEGYAIGTLCVMDHLPRELPVGHKESLITLAQLLSTQLQMRRSTAETPAVIEHERTVDALRHSQERLLGIISSAMDAIITVDDNQRIVVFNKAAEQIFRCPPVEALGQPLDKFIPQRFRETHRQHIRRFGDTGSSSRSMYSPGTLMGVRADGEEFPVEATISQVKTAAESLYTVILRDISVRKRTEEELRQSLKMEAVGQLAGGIAHEFNNYLAVIMGYSDLLAQDERQNESVRLTLAEINTATQRAASLTRQLLAFSRKQVLEPTVLDLNKSIPEAHNLLRRLLPANVGIVPVLQPDLGHVKADPVQVQQILINLAVNARDAMPQGGTISIETGEVILDEEFAGRYPEVLPGDYIMLSVTDTGEGINAETLPHIFEPFFTTKKEGKGTGLGLSTTYGIVKQSGGHITVSSVLGKGTTFRVYLPKLTAYEPVAAISRFEPAVHIEAIQEPAVHNHETILIVEDETALRNLMRGALEKEGYTVLQAQDGAEALSVTEQHPDIGLIVSDLAMPHMTGLELREKVAVSQPHIRFLLISGYAREVVTTPEQAAKFAEFLEKPFRPSDLTQKVRELLGRVSRKPGGSRRGNASPGKSYDNPDAENDRRLH